MKVELIAYTPNPDGICDMASKTCTSEGMPFVSIAVNKRGALERAIESGHESVLEHAVFTFSIEGISRACSHQLVRHRLASFSQQSQRYVKMDGFEYVTPPSIENASRPVWSQGDEDFLPIPEAYKSIMSDLAELYENMIKAGIPEEDARYILPNACATNLTVTMNARELRHFFGLRCCERAQWEIRELANTMLKLCQEVSSIMFDDAGPQCMRLGYCPESKGCGRYPMRSE